MKNNSNKDRGGENISDEMLFILLLLLVSLLIERMN